MNFLTSCTHCACLQKKKMQGYSPVTEKMLAENEQNMNRKQPVILILFQFSSYGQF